MREISSRKVDTHTITTYIIYLYNSIEQDEEQSRTTSFKEST